MEQQQDKTALETDVQALEILQGFGEKINVFLGMKDGKALRKAYHIAPVPIKHIPALTDLIMKFQKAAEKVEEGKGNFTLKDCQNGAKMIRMGLVKTMPEVEEDEILENFSFGTMIRTSQILIDLNDLGTPVDSEGNVVENPTKPVRRAAPN